MFVNQPDDAQLVALWDDPETCPAIARRLGVRQTWLTLQWRRLRQQDRLPTDRRRNASERRVDESSDGADGRPTIKTRDRLLKRLIAVRGSTCSTRGTERPAWKAHRTRSWNQRRSLLTGHHAQAPAVLDHSRTLPQG